MPNTATSQPSVQAINDEIRRLQQLKQELLAQLPESNNPLTKGLVRLLKKKIDKIERKILEAQKQLEERITASDLIKPEVLEDLKDTAEDLIQGNTDEALDQLKDTAKDVAVDKAKEVIDDKVKDESIKEHLGDVLDKAKEGDIDGIVDTVKEGLQEEVEEVIDDKVKNPKVAALIKTVLEGVVDGDFEGLLEEVADGIIGIAKDKLEDFIAKIIDLLKEELKLEVESRLKAEVQGLMDNSIVEAAKEAGGAWTAQLIATITKRLAKRAVDIVKEEVEHLATRETFHLLLDVLKDAAIQTLKSGLKGRKIKDLLKELMEHALNHPDFKKLVEESKERLFRKFLEAAIQEAGDVTEQLLDAYLRVNGTWMGPAFNMPKRELSLGPWWGCVHVLLGASAEARTSISAVRKGVGAEVKADVSGMGYLKVGVGIGFDLPDVPFLKDVMIKGGVEGGPKLSAYTRAQLLFEGSTLAGDVTPFTIDLNLAAQLFLETPLPNRVLKYVPAYLTKAVVVGSKIEYPLGQQNILQVTTPTYGLTVDPYHKGYVFTQKSGDFHAQLNPEIKAELRAIKDAFIKAAQDTLSALNPFGKNGWLSSLWDDDDDE